MRASLIVVGAIALAVGLVTRINAKDPRPANDDWIAAGDAMFDEFFGETDAERAAIENVEISVADERRIGDADLEGYLDSLRAKRFRVMRRGRNVNYVAALVEQLRPRMKNVDRYPTIRVHVADTREIDARAFPGGSIVVTTGMIDFAGSEAALVGVLGHELSHIDHGHQLRMARAAKLAQTGWSNIQSPQSMQQHISLMAKNFSRPYRAEDEAAADRDGATWAAELGYDPLELAKMFARFDRRNPRGPAQVPSFLLTHPYNADRFAAIAGLANDRKAAGQTLYQGRENLARRVPRTEREFHD